MRLLMGILLGDKPSQLSVRVLSFGIYVRQGLSDGDYLSLDLIDAQIGILEV